MLPRNSSEKPAGVYLGSFYFVLAGFLDSIQKYREWGSIFVVNPFSEHSIWHLAANTVLYLTAGYLLWRLTWLGRLLGLVYGYLTLATYLGALALFAQGARLNFTPLFVALAVFHVTALVPLVIYLQPAKRKQLFNVSLLEILLPNR